MSKLDDFLKDLHAKTKPGSVIYEAEIVKVILVAISLAESMGYHAKSPDCKCRCNVTAENALKNAEDWLR